MSKHLFVPSLYKYFLGLYLLLVPASAWGQCLANFNVSTNSTCAQLPVNFTATQDARIQSYRWNFNGQGTATGRVTSFSFQPRDAAYTANVTLTVTDTGGVSCQATQEITIQATPNISGNFSQTQLCLSENAERDTFTTVLTLGALPVAGDYTLDWGDGSPAITGTALVIQHTYERFGSFPVEVSMTNGTCMGYFRDTIRFFKRPSVAIQVELGGTDICEGETVELINNTDGSVVEYYLWDWGDGNFDEVRDNSTPLHSYDLSPFGTCNSDQSSFTVTVNAYNSCDSRNMHFGAVPVFVSPTVVAAIGLADTIVCSGESVSFQNLTCPEDNVLQFSWDFGDGNTSTDFEPTHTYSTPGVYTVSLEAINSSDVTECGAVNSARTIIVTDVPQVSVDFTGNGLPNEAAGCAPFTFVAENTTTPLTGVNFEWSVDGPGGFEFINNTGSTSRNPEIRFSQEGSYTVSLSASNECGTGELWEQSLEIKGPPGLSLEPTPDTCGEFSTSFFATTNPRGGTLEDIIWSFPGASPETFTGPNPTGITFLPQAEAYIIQVSTKNECASVQTTDTFLVAGLATLELSPDTAICSNGETLALMANPNGGRWLGEYVDSLTGEFLPPVGLEDTIQVLYQYGVGACQVEGSVQIIVNAGPDTEILAPDTVACAGVDTIILFGFPRGGIWENGDVDSTIIIENTPGTLEKMYSYTDTLTGCSGSASRSITISPLPDVATTDRTYCRSDQDIVLEGYSPLSGDMGTGSWKGPGVIDPTGIFNSAGVEEDELSLIYTFTTSAGCTDSAIMTLSLVEADTAEAGAEETYCQNEAIVNLEGGIPAGGRWVGPGVEPGTSQFNPAQANIGDNILTYIVGTEECETRDTKIIHILDTTEVFVGERQGYCEGTGRDTLEALPQGGIWSGPGIIDPVLGILDPDLLPLGEDTKLTYRYTNEDSCVSLGEKIVFKIGLPEVGFDVEGSMCVNTDLQFSNSSLADAAYLWDFGEGTTSTDTNPIHSYTSSGPFTVWLWVTASSSGCKDSTSQELVIEDVPSASFTPDMQEGCAQILNESLSGLPVQFSNNSQQNGGISIWDFGLGDTLHIEEPGTVVFPQGPTDTTYQIHLSISNQCGNSQAEGRVTVFPLPQVRIGLQRDDDCSPFVLDSDSLFNLTTGNPESFSWDLGNGAFSLEENPPRQVYIANERDSTYTLTLIAQNFCGADTGSQTLVVHPNTIDANFAIDSTRGCTPMTINPTDFSDAPFLRWDFGDGTAGETSSNPSHTYTTPGTFTLRLIAHNQCSFDTSEQQIQVLPAVASQGLIMGSLCVGEEVSFMPTVRSGIASFTWDFGDNTQETTENPLHVYSQAGSYSVRLTTLSDTFLCPSVWDTVLEVNALPPVIIDADRLEGCAPLVVNFTNQSGGTIYSWDFGNGNSSTSFAPSETYADPGSFPVGFNTEDANGCRNDSSFEIQVFPSPVAQFELPKASYCEGETFQPENLSIGNQNSYRWEMGNEEEFQSISPSYAYDEAGNYQITLTASNPFQCSSQVSQSLRVIAQPQADFTITGEPCTNQLVEFLPLDNTGDQWRWDFGDGGSSNSDLPTYLYALPGTYTVSLELSQEDQCFDQAELEWEVFESPMADFTFAFDTLPNGKVFFEGETMAATYQWWVDGQQVSSLQDFRYDFGRFDTFAVSLIVSLANGCRDTLTQFVAPPYGGLQIPTGFFPTGGTPIGDAQFFKPIGIGLAAFHIAVYNQWGNVVWESKALDAAGRPSEYWDGTTSQNKLSRNNAYVWKVLLAQFKDGRPFKGKNRGTLTLLR